AELGFALRDLQFDLDAGRLKNAGTASLLLHLRPKDVARVIQERAGNKVKDGRIHVDEDRIHTRGKGHAGFLHLGFHRASHPELKENAVYAHTFRVTLAGLKIPTRMIRKMEAKINPVVDFNELPVPVHVEKVGTEKGCLVLRARLDLNALVAEAPAEPEA